MVPTAVAQNIAKDIKEGLNLFRNTISDSSTFTPETARTTFKISMGDTSSYRLLPKLFKALGKKAPEIDFVSYLTPRRETPRELAAGNIDFSIDPDLALTSTKSFARSNNLKTFELPFKVDPLVLHLYWHETKQNDPANKWIRELILKSYG